MKINKNIATPFHPFREVRPKVAKFMKKLDRKVLVGGLFVLLALGVSGAFAQEDSSRVIPPDSAEYTVRIPDVIIYGEDVTRQKGGVKLREGEIGVAYPRIRTFKLISEVKSQRLSPSSLNLRPLLNQVYGGYGNFHTLRLGGWRSHSVNDFDYHLRASYESSRRHLRNADYWNLGVGASAGYTFTDLLNLTSNLSYSQREFGLYGSFYPQRRRELQKVDLNFDIKRNGRYSWEAGLGYQEAKAEDREGGVSSSSRRERVWGVRLGGLTSYRNISLLSDIQLRGFELKNRESLWEARVEGQFPLTKKSHLGAGLKGQLLHQGGVEQRFSPLFHLNYIPKRGVGFSLHLSGGFTPRLLRDSFSQNSYFYFPQGERWEDVRVRVSLGMEYEVKEGLFLRDVVVHQQIRDYLFWEGNSGLFRLGSFPEIRTLENNLFLRFSPYPKLNVELSLMLRDADLTRGDSLSTWHIPYWEKSGISLALDFPLRWGIDCWLGGEYHSRRYSSSTSDERLSSYYLVNFKMNKNLNDHFKVFFEGNNLTNLSYDIWKDYREPGINGLLGLSYKW